jgi:hypothetical protein
LVVLVVLARDKRACQVATSRCASVRIGKWKVDLDSAEHGVHNGSDIRGSLACCK